MLKSDTADNVNCWRIGEEADKTDFLIYVKVKIKNPYYNKNFRFYNLLVYTIPAKCQIVLRNEKVPGSSPGRGSAEWSKTTPFLLKI